MSSAQLQDGCALLEMKPVPTASLQTCPHPTPLLRGWEAEAPFQKRHWHRWSDRNIHLQSWAPVSPVAALVVQRAV